jgi:hypothetical protein
MKWGGFSFGGSCPLTTTSTRMKSSDYQALLDGSLLPYGSKIAGRGYVYQQDNARPHVSNSTMEWLKSHRIRTVVWPARSPDLNPMENLWSNVSKGVYGEGRQYNKILDLDKSVSRHWDSIEPQILENLIDSMDRRLDEVIMNNGDYTHY